MLPPGANERVPSHYYEYAEVEIRVVLLGRLLNVAARTRVEGELCRGIQ